ncbi:hypothetical protein F4V57_13960 [Acinetobacter qingfengensis]|uniref:Uncharacterized protein n=1 Tax=Acinetobacter qingfengensis TaxID=1262585 RepID=A0A1E7REM6_9GAMM|nr:hypothetical protein [Acinetobacter qingfengensis]KAA8731181.1 hypothetical protein F4V57_13960 [Acinetobacter qingfengensis]OEY97849.1 hypothetical protein BJI46_08100 [Acinetobacter qingfengensis]
MSFLSNTLKYFVFVSILTASYALYAKTSTFQDYPAKAYLGKNQLLKLNQQSKKYRTLLKQMSQQQPNFAGHYVLETVGCGGGCSFALAYNAKTGQSFVLPDTFTDCYSKQNGFQQNDIFFQKDSRLVVATGSRYGNPSQCEEVYYLVEQDRFKHIQNIVGK